MYKWLLIGLLTTTILVGEHATENTLYTDGQASQSEQNVDVNVVKGEEDLSRSYTTLVQNTTEQARVLFQVNVASTNADQQMQLAYQLHNQLELSQPGLSRGILTKSVFDETEDQALLRVSIGGMENTEEELNVTTDIIEQLMLTIKE